MDNKCVRLMIPKLDRPLPVLHQRDSFLWSFHFSLSSMRINDYRAERNDYDFDINYVRGPSSVAHLSLLSPPQVTHLLSQLSLSPSVTL